MNKSNVMFRNLRAEMARKNVTISEMARDAGFNRDTLSRKLAGKSPLNLDEAFTIQRMFFSDVGVNELFDEIYRPPNNKKKGA